MHKLTTILALLLAVGFNLAVSYVTTSSGYIAFVSTAIALGILATWQLVELVRTMLADRSWLLVKIGSLPLFAFAWFLLISGVVLSISGGNSSITAALTPLGWLAALGGVIAYLLPAFKSTMKQQDVKVVAIGLVVALYSIVLFLIASLGYHNPRLNSLGILLVIAVQLQYVMSKLALSTNYLERLYESASRLGSKLDSETSRLDLAVLVVGLPFFIPIAIIVLVLAVRS